MKNIRNTTILNVLNSIGIIIDAFEKDEDGEAMSTNCWAVLIILLVAILGFVKHRELKNLYTVVRVKGSIVEDPIIRTKLKIYYGIDVILLVAVALIFTYIFYLLDLTTYIAFLIVVIATAAQLYFDWEENK